MKPLFLFKSLNNNHYLFNFKKKQIIYCHPIMVEIILLWKEDISKFNIDYIYKQLSSRYNKNELLYYFNKIYALSKLGIFENDEIITEVDAEILPEMVKQQLANAQQITFEVTESCNLNCKYCGYGDLYWNHDERTYSKLDVGVAFNFLNYLINLWNSSLNNSHKKNITIGFYGGEPLLNFLFIKNTVRLIINSELKHNRVRFGMTTNGVLLDKYIEFLVEHNFYLLISLDGNEDHSSYRIFKDGSNSFKKVYENVLNIKEKYPDFFENNISFNSVLHNRNNVEDIITFFDENIGKIPRISQLNNIGIRKNKLDEFNTMFQLTSKSINDSKNSTYVKEKMEFNFPGNYNKAVFLNSLLDNTFWSYDDIINKKEINYIKRIPTGTCFPFRKKIFVTAKGKILPCERIGHQFSLGDVTRDKINLNTNNIGNKYKLYYLKLKSQCEKCYLFPICQKCIFNIQSLNENPICSDFTDYDRFQNYLIDSVTYFENNTELYEQVMKNLIIV